MRKWTMSACVMLAWLILPLVAVAGSQGPTPTDQANISIASYTRATQASEPGAAEKAEVTATLAGAAATWTVRPGDTLSAIAAALAVPGGWRALYAANRQAIGPDPNAIRPGVVVMAPRPAVRGQAARSQAPSRRPQRASAPAVSELAPVVGQSARRLTAPGGAAAPAGGMPQWLEDVLVAAGMLAATAFVAEPAAALARRRKVGRPARPARRARSARHRAHGATRDQGRQAAGKARIILADHERLIVTYCASDHTVYVLTPPGEDPRAILTAARLVLPEETYEDLTATSESPPPGHSSEPP